MFRPSMAIITELYLYPTKAIFMLKHSVKLRRYIYILGDVAKCLQWKGMFCNSIHPRLSLFVPFIVFYLQNLANPPPKKRIISWSYCYFRTATLPKVGPGSSVSIATGYGLDGPGIESRWGRETCPDQPWGPPSLLYNGYRVFPGGKERPGRKADPSLSSSAE